MSCKICDKPLKDHSDDEYVEHAISLIKAKSKIRVETTICHNCGVPVTIVIKGE